MKFPEIKTTSPSGSEVKLPLASRGFVTLVVITMMEQESGCVDTWREPFLNALDPADTGPMGSDIAFYEVLMLSDVWAAVPKSVPMPPVRTDYANRLTFSGKTRDYAAILGMDDPALCYAFLLDADGYIRWTGYGCPTRATIDELIVFAKSLKSLRAA